MQPAISTTPNAGLPLAGKKQTDDMSPEAWSGLVGGLLQFLAEEAGEKEHAFDALATPALEAAALQRAAGTDEAGQIVGNAAGVVHIAPDGKILLLRRSDKEANYAGHWALPGGGAEAGERPEEAAQRENSEEMGFRVDPRNLRLVDRTTTPTGTTFHTFAHRAEDHFAPKLNHEHTGYAWAPLDKLPGPIHPAVAATLRKLGGKASGQAKDADVEWGADLDDLPVDKEHDGPWLSCMAKDGHCMYRNKNVPDVADIDGTKCPVDDVLKHHEANEWKAIVRAQREFVEKHGREPTEDERVAIYTKEHRDHGTPSERTYVEALHGPGFWPKWSAWCRGMEAKVEKGPFTNQPTDADVVQAKHRHDLEEALDAKVAIDSAVRLALDRDTVREFDRDGRMHIGVSNISKANICPYRGDEIPGHEALGLQRDKVYYLLRDPAELEKGASSFNGIQLLKRHEPVDAEDHKMWDIVGTTGSNARYEHPYLKNDLHVWTKDGIGLIESDAQKELSCGYHYDPDMTPGVYEGQKYDGVMRNIVGNHVALVRDGRAGDDVVVGDSALDFSAGWAAIERALLGMAPA